MKKIMQSKDGHAKNRYIQEVIDGIFKQEKKESEENIQRIAADIQRWAHRNEIPINPSSTFIRREKEKIREMKKKERETIGEAVIDINEESDAQKLKKQYNITIDNGEGGPVSDQIASFCVTEGAYQEFKKQSTIDRMLHNFYKYNQRPPLVKPEEYLTIDELKQYGLKASPGYVPPKEETTEHDYMGQSAASSYQIRMKKRFERSSQNRSEVLSRESNRKSNNPMSPAQINLSPNLIGQDRF